jgi:restriction endonuclease Mrr
LVSKERQRLRKRKRKQVIGTGKENERKNRVTMQARAVRRKAPPLEGFGEATCRLEIQNVQVCDATDDEKDSTAGNTIYHTLPYTYAALNKMKAERKNTGTQKRFFNRSYHTARQGQERDYICGRIKFLW